jgi:hypothetical protein
MNDDKTHLVVNKSMAQVNINLVICLNLCINGEAAAQTAQAPFGDGQCTRPLATQFTWVRVGYVNGAFLSFGCFLKEFSNCISVIFSFDEEVVRATVHGECLCLT